MSIESLNPETLEQMTLWGNHLLREGGWLHSESEWTWAFHYARWSLLLEAAGVPGICLGEVLGALWMDEDRTRRRQGRQLARQALESLERQGALRCEESNDRAGPALYQGSEDVWNRALESLWAWLHEHTTIPADWEARINGHA